MNELRFAWLEITGKCQLRCGHCYASSGPSGTDGSMSPSDWTRVITEVSRLGGRMVQFIGGEPTLHRSLPDLVNHALEVGLEVEVFSNLVHISSQLWEVFARPGVRLATSYYSVDAAEHAAITRHASSHVRTRRNIVEALRRSIPLRVGLIDVKDGQGIEGAYEELAALGVREIGIDRARQVGRGARGQTSGVEQLCGNCGRGQIAIAPDGSVWPCVFSRWLSVGNVRQALLSEIITGSAMIDTSEHLVAHFDRRVRSAPCVPTEY
ncbi:MoaA/NifB/PqqE/SkfB family radical SAM enzyme [Herbihabitans rhizosphaerae]|uniref:MoaA/NifB/PqqE/SkfB family radical SAM enzyme n=1 Tax=Herbihabitans rhizosphaerae TaxID=1872711 RepID=A0A4Q7L3M9_9PSEU|nr:radical SAM protein [Herbihabitans rhizosphaerae]RZS43350.1 MoaA/NifB/PqqE/SkfB family radical SAM enzyme [Herbihabitans rhizosphaerae]